VTQAIKDGMQSAATKASNHIISSVKEVQAHPQEHKSQMRLKKRMFV
jgi:hypothetical protein